HMLTITCHFKCLYIRMIFRDVVPLCEIEPVKPVGDIEHSVYHIVYLKIWSGKFIIQIIFLLFDLFSIIPPVPGLKSELASFTLDYLLLCSSLSLCHRKCSIPYLFKEIKYPFRSFCHIALKHKIGITVISEKL